MLLQPPTVPESEYRIVEPSQNATPERRLPPSWPQRRTNPRACALGRHTRIRVVHRAQHTGWVGRCMKH